MVQLNIKELNEPEEKTWIQKLLNVNEVLPEKWKTTLASCSQTLWAGVALAQRGFTQISSLAWIVATGLIVIYLPLLRALDNEREFVDILKRDMVQHTAGAAVAPAGRNMAFDLSAFDLPTGQ